MLEKQIDFSLRVALEETSPKEHRSGHSEALSGLCLVLHRTRRMEGMMQVYIPTDSSYIHADTVPRSFFI